MPESHVDKRKTEPGNKPLRRMIRRIIPAPDEEKDDDDERVVQFELPYFSERRPVYETCIYGQRVEQPSVSV